MHDDDEDIPDYSDPRNLMQFVREGVDRIAEGFEEQDEDFAPVFFMARECPNHKDRFHDMVVVPVHEMMGSNNTKRALHKMVMPTMIQQFGAVSFAFVTSAWMVDLSNVMDAMKARNSDDPLAEIQKAMGGLQPSEHPDRYEAVFIIASNGQEAGGMMARILRSDSGDPPTLGEWSDMGVHETDIVMGAFDNAIKAVKENYYSSGANAN